MPFSPKAICNFIAPLRLIFTTLEETAAGRGLARKPNPRTTNQSYPAKIHTTLESIGCEGEAPA